VQYKFHATGFQGVLHFDAARLHQHREPAQAASEKGTGVVRRLRCDAQQLDCSREFPLLLVRRCTGCRVARVRREIPSGRDQFMGLACSVLLRGTARSRRVKPRANQMTRKPPPSAVPQSRLGRLARIGLAAGELAVGGAIEGLRRLGQPSDPKAGSPLFTAATARRLAERLSNLRGAAMKLGQLISLQGEDVLPPEFAQALAVLRSSAAPMPSAQLHRVLGREYGKGWERRFAEFDDEPIAAASIGQVHRARARDGRRLALKIQYPGVARSIASDVDNVAALLRMANVLPLGIDVQGIASEAKRQLQQESDYIAEGRFLEKYAGLVAGDPDLLVPRVHWDLTTPRVLAMDFVEGLPLEEMARDDVPQKQRDKLGAVLEYLTFRELFEFHVMQTDPNFANYLFQPETGRLVLLDFGATQEFTVGFVDRFRRITRAIVARDRVTIAEQAVAIGYLAANAPPREREAVVDVIQLVCEPLQHRGRYDFRASSLPARVRELGFDLAFKQGLLKAPPPDTMFLHRKLAGMYLLAARLGAHIDVRKLIQPLLAEPPARADAGS
jgi:predicted unusual protein kinase regulating ubiquinone biosynthesis (AarF/ABC1/UbiB family)